MRAMSNDAATAAVDATPRGQCERYSDETYAKMRDDEARTAAYDRAIALHSKGRTVLDIGTGALALLALSAARAGASHVYAVEANAAAAAAARDAISAAGFADKITLLEGYSTDVALPERVDLLVHEIIGEVAGAEGVGRAIADAAARHLRAGAAADGGVVSVPARARTLIAPAEFPDEAYFASLPHPMLAAPGATALKLPGLPMATRLAAPQPCEDLRFDAAAPALRQEATLTFVAERAGELRGLALHNEVFVADGELAAPEISSADPGSHWPHVLLMLKETAQLAAGDALTVRYAIDLAGEQPRYEFDVLRGDEALGTLRYPD